MKKSLMLSILAGALVSFAGCDTGQGAPGPVPPVSDPLAPMATPPSPATEPTLPEQPSEPAEPSLPMQEPKIGDPEPAPETGNFPQT
ncbi:MAG: hypothetical protein HUU46_11335 [Candidatus Hydrogenedentes bacterium]|nr:hypothetical protein [Candidatus Hydrogenedentota bacterium]